MRLLSDEIKGERKYRLNTTGFEPTEQMNISRPIIDLAYSYMPSNYKLLEHVFNEVNQYDHNQTFLDIGCGKGRAMMVAAHYDFKKITGVEINLDYCTSLSETSIKYQNEFNCSFEIICGDASEYHIPDDVQTIFFYNPFKEPVMRKVVSNIMSSLSNNKRELYIIYLNPLYSELLLERGFIKIYDTDRYNELKGSIYYRKDH
jgi:SAM-dependent methyltransferase